MAILTKEEARTLLEKVIKLSKADTCTANLYGNVGGNIRYARNAVTTSGTETNTQLSISSSFGKKVGTTSINELDDDSLEKAVRRSEELAKLSPENPEFMEPLGPQKFKESKTFSESTANINPTYRAVAAKNSIGAAKEQDLITAGFLENYYGYSAMINSKGLFAYEKYSGADFTVTMRTKDGTGSGWASRSVNDINKLDTTSTSIIAAKKAALSKEAKAIEPGKYTVILEPQAAAGLLGRIMWNMGARGADEGRSFLAKKGGGTKLGEKIIDERITIYSDPFHPEVPGSTWSREGLPVGKKVWIDKGVVKNLYYSRYWAKEKGVDPVPFPDGAIMNGTNKTLEDLIKGTEKGILVTRLWYIRTVDPQTLLYTGLTRDGTFYIEDGKIKFPVKNFRFNESPIIMLNNLEALGKPERVDNSLIPPVKVRDFTFTSLSDAI